MSECPEGLKYTDSHEWVSVEDNVATIGITEHAQSQLGELVFVELPEVNDELKNGEEAGVLESVKTASDFYTPVSGKVVESNIELADTPEMVNESPYGDGWLFKIELSDQAELDSLLSAEDYRTNTSDEEYSSSDEE